MSIGNEIVQAPPSCICGTCGAEMASSLMYCTSCGSRLNGEVPLRLAPIEHVETRPQEPSPDPPVEEIRVTSRAVMFLRPRLTRAAAALVAGALVIIFVGGFFLYSWRAEVGKHGLTQDALAASQQEVRVLTSEKVTLTNQNKVLTKDLASAEATASRRGALLARTDKVLDGVEPLLSTVDSLKVLTTNMQTERHELENASRGVISDLFAFIEYVLDSNPIYWDISYLSGLVDDIGQGSREVRSASSRLSALDTKYGRASSKFETRATAFATNVRQLEAKLKSER